MSIVFFFLLILLCLLVYFPSLLSPSDISIERDDSLANKVVSPVIFAKDDWHLTSVNEEDQIPFPC